MTHDWDALAPFAHLLDELGSGDDLIDAVTADGLVPPVLFVGAGRGRYAARLRDRAVPVLAVDLSPAMARRGRAETRLPYVVADVRALPIFGAAFGTVVCATGVIELLDRDDRRAAIAELARVGPWCAYLAAFAHPGQHPPPPIDLHDAIDRWHRAGGGDALFDGVAAQLRDRAAAAALLRRALPRTPVSLAERTVVDDAASLGLSTRRLAWTERTGTMIWRLGTRV